MAAVPDGAGGVIVLWVEEAAVDPVYRAQRVDATGQLLWDPDGMIALANLPGGLTYEIAMVADGDGGCVDGGGHPGSGQITGKILLQWLDTSGTPYMPQSGLEVAPGSQFYIDSTDAFDLLVVGSDHVAIAWGDLRNLAVTDVDVYLQSVSRDGTLEHGPEGIPVCQATGSQTEMVLTDLGSGDVLVHWNDTRDFASRRFDIYAQRFDPSGSPRWTSDGVPVATTPLDDVLALAVAGPGDTVLLAFQSEVASGNRDVVVQCLANDGSRLWTTTGISVCNAVDNQRVSSLVADGFGGMIIAWQDNRPDATSGGDIYLQRVDSGGGSLWGANGIPAAPRDGHQGGRVVQLAADGTGGAWVLTDILTSPITAELLVAAVDASGTRRWNAPCRATLGAGDIVEAGLALAPDGGAVLGLGLHQGTQLSAAAARVDASGYVGEPEPAIFGVRDFPQDQGGVVLVDWLASHLDTPIHGHQVDQYSLWRRLPGEGARADSRQDLDAAVVAGVSRRVIETQRSSGWEFVGVTPARALIAYSEPAPTFADSTEQGVVLTEFMVLAEAVNGSVIPSPVAAGYSVDNLPPGVPLNLVGVPVDAAASLQWSPAAEPAPDLAGYRVYRGEQPGFPLDPSAVVGTAVDTLFTDPAPGSGTWYYRVAAVDHHGNQGPASNEAAVAFVSADAPLPGAVVWRGAAPNPFNPRTTLSFDLPHAMAVSLVLHDQRGRRVRTLADGTLSAGRHQLAWDGRDDTGRSLAAGVYLAVLRTERGEQRGKLTLVR
ncbi:MAG: FlgD immunoglobulin-like domain containing protein [Candidatus Krumholzibacteriia bacterium]